MKGKVYDWIPTPDQEMLLISALSGKKEALRSWEQWKACNDIDRMDRGSYRLLPMVFSNLKDHVNKEDELYGKLKGTYRKSWFSNHMLVGTARLLFSDLRDAGIDPLLLKGIHLISSYYEDAACRPLGDVDFLVGWEEAGKADAVMRSKGWRMKIKPHGPVFRENIMSSHKSEGYINSQGYQCDLHWNILGHRCYPGADEEFIKRAVYFEMKGEKYRGLCPEDLFLHVIEHGAYCSLERNVRWVPDILAIIKKNREPDWDLIFHNVIRTGLELPVSKMVNYLYKNFNAEELRYFLEKLRCHPVSGRSRALARRMSPARTKLGHRIKGSFGFYVKYRIFMSEYRNEPVTGGIVGFVRFLKFRFDTESYFVLSVTFLKRALNILKKNRLPSG